MTELQHAIRDVLVYCMSQDGKTQHGYFSPNGFGGQQLLKALPDSVQKQLLKEFEERQRYGARLLR